LLHCSDTKLSSVLHINETVVLLHTVAHKITRADKW